MKTTVETRVSSLLFAAALLLCSVFAHAQVTVAIAPDPHPQFLDAVGNPLASGFIYTYQAGTNTLLSTYVDSTGNVQNPDPIPLDVTGAPSNGSVQTGIWLANTAYKFCAYNAAMVQQWCTDNVTSYLGLLNLPNLWSFQQTFALPIIDTATDNQIVLGQPGNRTTFDAPPMGADVAVHVPFLSVSDTFVMQSVSQNISNKTILSPIISQPTLNAVLMPNSPGTYVQRTNEASTGTFQGTLTKSSGLTAIITGTGDTSGFIGICVALCGTTGIAVIQQSGDVTCAFDAATTADDYVQNSPTVAGDCHDIGASYPTAGQVVGRVQSTNGSSGSYVVNLFGPEITVTGSVRAICATGAAANTNGNTTSLQAMGSCSFPAGTLNTLGKSFRVTMAGAVSPNSSITSTFAFANGSASSLAGSNSHLTSQTASSASMIVTAQVTCSVRATGASGTLICAPLNFAGGSGSPTAAVADFTLANVDFTSTLFVGPACSFSAASVSNICTLDILTVEQLN